MLWVQEWKRPVRVAAPLLGAILLSYIQCQGILESGDNALMSGEMLIVYTACSSPYSMPFVLTAYMGFSVGADLEARRIGRYIVLGHSREAVLGAKIFTLGIMVFVSTLVAPAMMLFCSKTRVSLSFFLTVILLPAVWGISFAWLSMLIAVLNRRLIGAILFPASLLLMWGMATQVLYPKEVTDPLFAGEFPVQYLPFWIALVWCVLAPFLLRALFRKVDLT